jgi:hypothetical protein
MSTLLLQAEEFYEANTALCESLAAEAKAAGADEGFLDEVIHEGADNEGLDSEEASSVNNAGPALQVASILEGNGIEQGSRIVREAFGGAAPRP